METQANEHWENGRVPLVGRLYEVQSLREIEGQKQREAYPPGDVLGTSSKGSHVTPSLALEIKAPGTRPAGRTVLPFVERIAAYVPGASITVQRTLTLDEDLHLADHTFVHAPGVKPVSGCLPVVPLTMAMEIMAETAACLAPGFGLIGFEDVTASRWIELADTDTLELRISAETAQFDNDRKIYRIATAIYVSDQPRPAIQSRVLFAPQYCLDLSMSFADCENVRPHSCTGEQLYQNRHLFHGPTYQLLTGQILVHSRGITGHALVKAPTNLFQSTDSPQLLIHPTLLDTVGQLLGVWAIEQRDRQVFPIGMKKLELYRPTPVAGSRLPLRVELTQEEAKTLTADVEIQDGAGSVWLRIRGWGAWKFRWPKQVTDFRRLPTRFPLSRQTELPGLPATAVCCMILPADVGRFDATLLARFYLDMNEMRACGDKCSLPRRQQHWLLGRIAAKDAARIWLARNAGSEEMLHPAALPIESDENGQPRVARRISKHGLPKLSIAHCDDGVIALAHSEAVGVDIEPIRQREPAFFETIANEAERRLLSGRGSVDVTGEWVTRVWCAKEAAGKLLGTGMNGSPRAYEFRTVKPDGMFQGVHVESGREIAVRTVRDHDLIIAYASDHVAASDQVPA
jgi:phosphopantetheinyl transferase